MRGALVAAATLLVASVAAAAPSNKEVIQKIVRTNQLELKACWEEALARDPSLQEGRVVVEFTVDKGFLTDATVVESSLHDEKTEACFTKTMKTWAFPQIKKPTTVRYPFVFKR